MDSSTIFDFSTLFDDGTFYAKYAMDGAETLSDAAARLRAFADELVELERQGWQLDEPVCDGWLHASPPGAQARGLEGR